MLMLYSHFYRFFTCIGKQILPASIFRQLSSKTCKEKITEYLDENRFED